MGWVKQLSKVGCVMVAVAACGGGDETEPTPEALAGTWEATKAEFVSQQNPAQEVELIGLGGMVVMTMTENHTFTLDVTIPGEPPEQEQFTGSWSASADVLTFTYSPSGTWQFDNELSGNTLRLTGADGSFDVDGDGGDDPVR